MVVAVAMRRTRGTASVAWLLIVLAGCTAGLKTKSGSSEAEDVAPLMTPEQQAGLNEAMAMAARDAAEAKKARIGEAEAAKLSLSVSSEKASASPRNDGIHDTINESLLVLQDPSQAMGKFPRDRRGEVDWVAALAEGLIAPRADLKGLTEMQTLDMDILMKGTQFMPWVKFPHSKHTLWLDCSNCHSEIFEPKMGANDISMNAVLSGEFCGVCHGKVSFSLFVCERCHSVPHPGSGEKWW